MKALLLSFGLGLVAALQSQDFPDTKGPQDFLCHLGARISGQCQEMRTDLEKTDQPDKYTAYRDTQGVYFIASAVEDHYTFYWESSNLSFPFQVAKLLGRDPDINPEALEDFRNIVKYAGLNAENIFIPEQNETCSLGNN